MLCRSYREEYREVVIHMQGDVLEDVELVESLEETKRTAVSVQDQVKAAKGVEVSVTCVLS